MERIVVAIPSETKPPFFTVTILTVEGKEIIEIRERRYLYAKKEIERFAKRFWDASNVIYAKNKEDADKIIENIGKFV